jgi:hypothetical protein
LELAWADVALRGGLLFGLGVEWEGCVEVFEVLDASTGRAVEWTGVAQVVKIEQDWPRW